MDRKRMSLFGGMNICEQLFSIQTQITDISLETINIFSHSTPHTNTEQLAKEIQVQSSN